MPRKYGPGTCSVNEAGKRGGMANAARFAGYVKKNRTTTPPPKPPAKAEPERKTPSHERR